MKDFMNNQSLTIPAAIIVAGLLIAGALMYGGESNKSIAGEQEISQNPFRAVDETDHTRGNPEGSITIIEYSDFECPFCKRLHPTLTSLLGENPEIRWVYRHFPLTSHPNAAPAAEASECVALLGGNSAFWQFADAMFENQRSLGPELYENQASRLEIDLDDFNECLQREDIGMIVQDDFSEVRSLGANGTPFSLLISPDGSVQAVPGAVPLETWRSLLP